MLSELAQRSDSCDPKWALTRKRKRAVPPGGDMNVAPKQRAEEGKGAPPQPHCERKRQRALKGESERLARREAATTVVGKTPVLGREKKKKKRRTTKGYNSAQSASSSQRKRRGKSCIEQEESGNADGLATQNRSGKATAHTARQTRAASRAAHLEPRHMRKEERLLMGGDGGNDKASYNDDNEDRNRHGTSTRRPRD